MKGGEQTVEAYGPADSLGQEVDFQINGALSTRLGAHGLLEAFLRKESRLWR